MNQTERLSRDFHTAGEFILRWKHSEKLAVYSLAGYETGLFQNSPAVSLLMTQDEGDECAIHAGILTPHMRQPPARESRSSASHALRRQYVVPGTDRLVDRAHC